MKKSKLAITSILSLFLAMILTGTALAQGQDVVTAQVDRNNLSTDEVLVLTVTINARSSLSASPTLPALDGFQLAGSNSSTQISLVNGDMSIREVYQFQLRPTRTGDLAIEPITAMVNGQTYSTGPITVSITQGTGQMQPGPGSSQPAFPSLPNFPNLNIPSLPGIGSSPFDPSGGAVPVDPAAPPQELVGREFFVEAVVDNPTPYQGEQVIYTFRFFEATDSFGMLEQPEYQSSSFSGFWHELRPERGEYRVQAGGRTYNVTQMQTVLFPTVVGEITIEPAILNIPGGFFSRAQTLQTEPITLDVRPLPGNAPAGFRGAVGRFSIQAHADKSATQVNDTVTMQVTLSGQGNIETLPDPVWLEDGDWRAFDSQASIDTDFENGIMGGTKTYSRVLVPTNAGNLTLPAAQFIFFDPKTESYQSISTEPIAITVSPGTDAAGPTFPAANSATANALPRPLEIRPLKSATTASSLAGSALTGQPGYWLLWMVPLLVVSGHLAWQRHKTRARNNLAARRSQQAAKVARRALQQAVKNPEQAQYAAGQILTDYISKKLNRSIGGLTHTELANVLLAKGIAPALVERVQSCLMLSDMGRYAPESVGVSAGDTLAETRNLINELDKEFQHTSQETLQ